MFVSKNHPCLQNISRKLFECKKETARAEKSDKHNQAQFVLATGQRFYTESMRHPRGFGTQLRSAHTKGLVPATSPRD